MDGDRSVVDGRDIFESKLQKLLREAWAIGCGDGYNDEWSDWHKELFPKLHELVISYLDGPTSDVGTQDETSQEGEMGNSVRQEGHLIPRDPDTFVWDEAEFLKELEHSYLYGDGTAHLLDLKPVYRYTFKEFDDILPSTKPQVDEAF